MMTCASGKVSKLGNYMIQKNGGRETVKRTVIG